MYVQAYVYDGDPRFLLQYGGDSLDTATTIDSWLIQPNQKYPFYCHYTQAGNAGLVNGVQLTGATSGAVIKVGHVVLTQGAVASAGMGILFFQFISGKILNGENLQVGGVTYCVAASGQQDAPLTPARSIFVSVETDTIRYCIGGATPTNAAGTPANFGIDLPALSNIVLSSPSSITTFSMLNAASESNATVEMVINF